MAFEIPEDRTDKPRRRRREVWILDREGREELACEVGPALRELLDLPAGTYGGAAAEESEEER